MTAEAAAEDASVFIAETASEDVPVLTALMLLDSTAAIKAVENYIVG